MIALNTDAATLSPIALFLQADYVVKAVMLGLLLASIWTWAIIIATGFRLGRIRRRSAKFERDFLAAKDIDRFHRAEAENDLPAARVLGAGIAEWRRSTAGKTIDRDGTRERLATSMGATAAEQIDELGERLNVLATIGSVAPFVGLFGTVWGIMRRLYEHHRRSRTPRSRWSHRASPRLCLPPQSGSLLRSGQSSWSPNGFSHAIDRIEARLNRFADGFRTEHCAHQLDEKSIHADGDAIAFAEGPKGSGGPAARRWPTST